MKTFFRLFFKTVRIVLGPFLLLWERLTLPKGIERSPEAQARLDAVTRNLVLYQYKTCPFCLKVRRRIARLGLNIEKRDAQHDAASRAELEQQGGQIKVPCLRITDASGQHTWLYESKTIIRHLEELADFS
ncbi:MAG: glutaredoxin [Gammaproteobacteria bacterium]|nr:glutaredoxin [Gammaproteobacteria bacterium]